MADLHTNEHVPDSHAPSKRRAITGQTSKLRDSCHACALSKVKCHKEKPTCSRCAKRSITCEYFATKRPGRKRDTNQTTNNHSNGDTNNIMESDFPSGQVNLWPSNIVTSSSTKGTFSASNNYLPNALTPPLDLSPISHRTSSISGPDFSLSDIFTMPLESSLSSVLAGMGSDLDAFFTSPRDFFEFEPPDSNFAQGHNDAAKLLLPDNVNLNSASETPSVNHINAFSMSPPCSNSQALSTNDTRTDGASDLTCRCLTQTLDLTKKLSNIGHISNSSAQTVVVENKQAIETVSNILQCSCVEDCYLLIMLSMAVFKIMGRYAAAARKQPEGGEKPNDSTKEQMRQTSSYDSDDESLWRIAAQLILSELHRVQRLVNQLSPRLKTRGKGEVGKDGEIIGEKKDREKSTFSPLLDCKAPFSATTLDQIEIDLRKSLGNLSSEIIDMLRQS